MYRHFPTREALLEALLRASFDAFAKRAAELVASKSADGALELWLRGCVDVAREYRGVTTLMMAAIDDPGSALHESCVAMRAAGTRLLTRAQAAGTARSGVDGTELFALVGASAWLNDQPGLAPRADQLFGVVLAGLR